MLLTLLVLIVFVGSLAGGIWWMTTILEKNQTRNLEMLREMRERDAETMKQVEETRHEQVQAWGETLKETVLDTTKAISKELYGDRQQVEQGPDTEQVRADQEWFNRPTEEVGEDPTDLDLEDPLAWDAASRVANVRPGENPFGFMEPDQTGEAYDG